MSLTLKQVPGKKTFYFDIIPIEMRRESEGAVSRRNLKGVHFQTRVHQILLNGCLAICFYVSLFLYVVGSIDI